MSLNANIAEKVKFIDFCNLLEKIQKSTVIAYKEKHLRRYIESFNEFRKKFQQENGNDCEASFYCILRCLVPKADNAREKYKIQTITMGNLYVKILNLASNSDDAQRLHHKTIVNGAKDYADVVYSVMKNRANDQPSNMNLADIHKLLDTIAECKDRKKIEQALTAFIQNTSAIEQKWLIRIILKSLHLGIGEQKIFYTYHSKAKDLYTRHSDLRKMCQVIESGENIDVTGEATPFFHIKPMLCGRFEITQLENLLSSGVFYLETKMDGERCHLHMSDENYKYISRLGKDNTNSYGANASEGSITPLIANLFRIKIKNIIVDGEMMIWNKDTNKFHVKGEYIDVKHLSNTGPLRPCLILFDLLYLNDKSYLEVPYVERIATLRKIFKEQTGVLSFCKTVKVKSVEHFRELFNEAIKQEEEGVVLKNQISVYKPGHRNAGWYKVKPDYIDGITTDLDLLIIGGFYNSTRTMVDKYVLGICKKNPDENEMATFYSVANVSPISQLSLTERQHLNEMLKTHWQSSHSPNFLEWGTSVPDVWINPKDSVVLQIRAAELVKNASFRADYSLRFPRIDIVRRDKDWTQCMDLEEYEKLYKSESNVKKMAKRGLHSEDFVAPKKTKLSVQRGDTSNAYDTKFHSDMVKKVTDEFCGFSICILSTNRESGYTVSQLKEIVAKHGGKVVENPLLDSKKCFCIAGDITQKIKAIKDTELYNIVSLDWLLRAFTGDTVRPELARPKPRDMICSTADMKEELEKYFDQYGDSYTDHVDEEEMQILMQEIGSKDINSLQESEIKSLEEELYSTGDNPNFYRGLCGYFYAPAGNPSRMAALAKLVFEFRGGQSIDSCNQTGQKKRISYIFVDTLNFNMKQFKIWLDDNFQKRLNVVKVVSYDWIFKCDHEKKIIGKSEFLIDIFYT